MTQMTPRLGALATLVTLLIVPPALAQTPGSGIPTDVVPDNDQTGSRVETEIHPSLDEDRDGFLANDEFRSRLDIEGSNSRDRTGVTGPSVRH